MTEPLDEADNRFARRAGGCGSRRAQGLAGDHHQRSDAVWFAPQGAVEGLVERGELKRLAIDTTSTEGPVGLTMRRGDEPAEGTQLLIETIREIVAARHRAIEGVQA